MLSLSRAGVQFLVREQRSHMLLNTARKEKKKMQMCQKSTEANLKANGRTWNNMSIKLILVVDYKPENKVSVCEPILI